MTIDDEGLRANRATFRDGKVVEMVHYPDPRDALAAARTNAQSGDEAGH